jgi:hypothetical protein
LRIPPRTSFRPNTPRLSCSTYRSIRRRKNLRRPAIHASPTTRPRQHGSQANHQTDRQPESHTQLTLPRACQDAPFTLIYRYAAIHACFRAVWFRRPGNLRTGTFQPPLAQSIAGTGPPTNANIFSPGPISTPLSAQLGKTTEGLLFRPSPPTSSPIGPLVMQTLSKKGTPGLQPNRLRPDHDLRPISPSNRSAESCPGGRRRFGPQSGTADRALSSSNRW